MSSELVIAALIYIERLLKLPGATLNEANAKGVLHVALTLASKFYLDRYEKNTIFYGIVIGLHRHQMRQMTDTFIGMLDFNLFISEEEFLAGQSSVKTEIVHKYAMKGIMVVHESKLRAKKAQEDSSIADESSHPKPDSPSEELQYRKFSS